MASEHWFVEPTPAVDIAGTTPDSEVAFNYASAATRLSNGVIVVADREGHALRFFDPSGRPLRTVGRDGEGPGEFRAPYWVGQCAPDSVFVWDAFLDRMTVFDSAGRHVRQYHVRGDLAFMECSRSGVVAGLVQPNMGMMSAAGPHYTAPLLLADTRGEVTKSLGDVPYAENRPLGKLTRFALSDDRLYVGSAESAYVDVYTLDGRRMGVLPIGAARRRPTDREYERAIDRWLGPMTRSAREFVRARLFEIPKPKSLPPYLDLLAEPDGTLWAQVPAPHDSATELRAIDPDGRILADLLVPQYLEVFEVGRDYILGMYEERDGEQHVVLYRLHRTR